MQEAIIGASCFAAGAILTWLAIGIRIARRDWSWYFWVGELEPKYTEDMPCAVFRGTRRSYKVVLERKTPLADWSACHWSSTEFIRPTIGKITQKEWHAMTGLRGRIVEIEDFLGIFWISDFLDKRQGPPPLPFRPPVIEGIQQ